MLLNNAHTQNKKSLQIPKGNRKLQNNLFKTTSTANHSYIVYTFECVIAVTPKSAIFQMYNGENMLHLDEIMMSALY